LSKAVFIKPKNKKMLTKEFIGEHAAAAVGGVITVTNTNGWYSGSMTVTYTFNGKEVKQVNNNITIGTNAWVIVPEGATNIFLLVEEWWGFGWYKIFTWASAAPETACFDIWGTTLNPHWAKVTCK
jgi:hypothetical protein